jgi:hypothetical protein
MCLNFFFLIVQEEVLVRINNYEDLETEPQIY